jgi:hypothetical protein
VGERGKTERVEIKVVEVVERKMQVDSLRFIMVRVE